MTPVNKVSATAARKTPMKPSTAPLAPAKSPSRKAIVKKSVTSSALSKAVASNQLEKITVALKIKKTKLVRDSFTIPKPEYLVLDELKQRATRLTRPAKKSELLRAGIKMLAALSDAAFLTALAQVPAIKTGRPTQNK